MVIRIIPNSAQQVESNFSSISLKKYLKEVNLPRKKKHYMNLTNIC